ncbi:hypothetical protein [Streptomyces sp. 11-1-2]|uniref:hypothetical protein n=1 Tax=Streptomyces sp. 11-1-2 TaxID=1851167 RepID=UPI000B8D3693|nr:hypothetical protein [Streptomyces sp. 11-1-2]ASQ95665.1 hypothetical protein CGL27_23710 [Streptomyces sp. 11-1-2]
MLNRIRRAASLARARHFSKGRHRRPLTPPPPVAPVSSARPDEPTLSMGRATDWARHRYSLTAEETALVRPYVLAWERRARQHPTVVVTPHLPTEAWSALLEAR